MVAPKFKFSPGRIRKISRSAFARFDEELAAILKIKPRARTFENTVAAYCAASDRLLETCNIPMFLKLVSPDAAVRKAAADLELKYQQHDVELLSRAEVYGALREFAELKPELAPMERRLLSKLMHDFEKNGLSLSGKKRAELKACLKELNSLSDKFGRNLSENNDSVTLTAAETAGLPENFLAGLSRTDDGSCRLPLEFSNYGTFMENCGDQAARRRVFAAFFSKCAKQNTPLLERALVLRRKVAKLMGYANFADYITHDRMAKSGSNVAAFLERIKVQLQRKARPVLAKLERLKGGDSIYGWDAAYYTSKLKSQELGADFTSMCEYFPLEQVQKGMFGVFGELLGIRVAAAPNPVWHKSVQAFEIKDQKGSLLAYFYLDLFPRQGKYKNGFCAEIRRGYELENGEFNIPALAILMNLAMPAAGRPAMLSFRDVQTLFHEFGHIIQLSLARSRYSRLGPVCAAWDFIEIPSTTFQQWIYEPSVLRRISGHYKRRGEKLPAKAIKAIADSRYLTLPLSSLLVLARSMADMRYHTAPGSVDTGKVYADMMEKVSLVSIGKGLAPQASFGHMMSDYPAAYYAYVWAEVVAADIFAKFKAAGITNKALGKRYIKCLIKPGSTRPEEELVADFLGRPFSEKAFIKSL